MPNKKIKTTWKDRTKWSIKRKIKKGGWEDVSANMAAIDTEIKHMRAWAAWVQDRVGPGGGGGQPPYP